MPRVQICLMCVCLIAMSVGCRNRCNTPCGNGWLAGGSTLAPPATYSLNIPSVANNQPYYTPGQTPPTNSTLNTNQRAPTPATQNGASRWRASDNDLSNRNTNDGGNPAGESRSVLTSRTKFVESNPVNTQLNPGNQPFVRTASLPGSGASFTNSQNYQTTSVDERRDATRLPVTDASAVRATSRNFPTGTVPANYSAPLQQTFVQNGYQVPAGYNGAAVLVNGNPAYQGQAVLYNPNVNRGFVNQGFANQGFSNPAFFPQGAPTSTAPTVLAQSTTTINPGNVNQVGWHSRELNSDRINR